MSAGSKPGAPLVAVLGARLARDGSLTAVLRARIEAALVAGRADPASFYLASGAPERHGRSEAQAIADALLEAGIEPARILLDAHSTDTLDQLRRIATFTTRDTRRTGPVILATSRFHAPRCRALARLFGLDARMAPVTLDRAHISRAGYRRRLFLEGLSLVCDVALALALRLTGRWPLDPRFEPLAGASGGGQPQSCAPGSPSQ